MSDPVSTVPQGPVFPDTPGDSPDMPPAIEVSPSGSPEAAATSGAAPSAPATVADAPSAVRFVRTDTREVSATDLASGKQEFFWKEVETAACKEPALDRVRALADRLASFSGDEKPRLLAFDDCRKDQGERFVVVRDGHSTTHFWIVGDLHGDILGLETVLRYVNVQPDNPSHSIVFLGDLFDRGKHGAEVLYRVLSLIVEKPETYGFIVGNHDAGLQYDEGEKCFVSDVHPSEFADWLNATPEDSPWRLLARRAITFFRDAPRALLLPDGLLVAHGGVPHVDVQQYLATPEDFNGEPALTDFAWTRLHYSAKRKIPNRATRGCSLGITDFDAFCDTAERVLHRSVRGLVRGHDHLEKRHRFFEKYEQRPVLTVNTMCCQLEGEMFGEFYRPAVLAFRAPDGMPVVHELKVPEELVRRFYGDKAAVTTT